MMKRRALASLSVQLHNIVQHALHVQFGDWFPHVLEQSARRDDRRSVYMAYSLESEEFVEADGNAEPLRSARPREWLAAWEHQHGVTLAPPVTLHLTCSAPATAGEWNTKASGDVMLPVTIDIACDAAGTVVATQRVVMTMFVPDAWLTDAGLPPRDRSGQVLVPPEWWYR